MSVYSKIFNHDKLREKNSSFGLIDKLITNKPKKILDVGCSSGYFGKYLKDKYKAIVWGIEIDKQDALNAKKTLDEVITKNLENCQNWKNEFGNNKFDLIICADIIEHLIDPWKFVKKLKQLLTPTGSIIFSIPNVGHYTIKLSLLNNQWRYQNTGLMDKTHLRFFTYQHVIKLIEDADLFIQKIKFTTSEIPKVDLLKLIKSHGLDINSHKLNKNLSSKQSRIFQYIVKVSKKEPKGYASYQTNNKSRKILKTPHKYIIDQQDVLLAKPKSPLLKQNTNLIIDNQNLKKQINEIKHLQHSRIFKVWKIINKVKKRLLKKNI